MVFAQTMYFSKTILKSQYKRLIAQLESGAFKVKKSYRIIVLKPQGNNLFECVSQEEYNRMRLTEEALIVSGIIIEQSEFPMYVQEVMEQLIVSQRPITKKSVIKWLTGDADE